MNILYLKYAVEVAKTKSISRAAENLYMGQPNLSRAIKELEESLGITIFARSPQGVKTTPEGEEFLSYAKNILRQIDGIVFVHGLNHGLHDNAQLALSNGLLDGDNLNVELLA